MKPFREFYLDKWPDASVYPAIHLSLEPKPPVAVRIAEACADYMDAIVTNLSNAIEVAMGENTSLIDGAVLLKLLRNQPTPIGGSDMQHDYGAKQTAASSLGETRQTVAGRVISTMERQAARLANANSRIDAALERTFGKSPEVPTNSQVSSKRLPETGGHEGALHTRLNAMDDFLDNLERLADRLDGMV